MQEVKQSTNRNVMVFMTDSSDHVSGKTGLTLTITASKDGAAFASISPTVTERGNGWYNVALTTSHTDTLGDLALHVTSAGADATDKLLVVVTELSGVVASILAGAITAAAIATDAIDADAIKADAVTEIQSGLATAASISALNNLSAAQVNAEVDTALADVGLTTTITGRIDAAISTRLASASYTEPLDAAGTRSAVGLASANLDTQIAGLATAAALDAVDNFVDTEIAAIKTVVDAIQAKTDNLPSDPADASVIAGRFDTLDTSVADLPTNAELSTALAAADDAVLAQVALVKAKTDQLAFGVANTVNANVTYVNETEVDGVGSDADPWGPV